MAIVKHHDTLADSATGRPIAGTVVQVFDYPSEANAVLYNSAGEVSTAPVVTDKDGYYSFHALGGRYNITYYHGGITRSLVDVLLGGAQGPAGPPSSGYTLLSSYGSLAAMVAAIGPTAKATVAVDASYSLASDFNTGNIELLPLNGNTITTTGFTLTYNGSTARWPLAQIFNGTGAVAGLKEARPEWFYQGGLWSTAINKALLAAKGGAVIGAPSTTYLTDPAVPLVIHEGTTLYGGGKSTLIKKNAISGIPMLVNSGYDTMPGYTADGNITIHNLAWDDRADIDTVSATGDVLGIGHADGVVIHHCHFINHKAHGVDFTGVRNCRAYENIFYSGKGSGIQVDSAYSGAILGVYPDNTPSYNVHIYRNSIYSKCHDPDSGAGGYVGGIHLHRNGHRHIYIFENYIQGANQGIFADPNVDYNDIHIYRNKVYGKYIDGSTTKISDTHHYGIRALCNLSNSSIKDNTIAGWDNGGIKVTYNANPLTYTYFLEVSGNSISDVGGNLIHIQENYDLTVHGNILKLDRDVSVYGVYLTGVVRFSVQSNKVCGISSDDAKTGIYVKSGALATLSGLVLFNHISAIQSAIHIYTGSDIVVDTNKVKSCGTPFIVIGVAATSVHHQRNANYDSGWVQIVHAQEITLSHNLSIVPTTLEIYVALDEEGTGSRLAVQSDGNMGVCVTEIGINSLKVRGGVNGVVAGFTNVGVWGLGQLDGYLRLRASI